MDEAADKIEAHIDRTRERLGSNLRELEDKVDAATDWREQFRARPHLFLGGAIIGGALLAAALRPKSPRQAFDSSTEAHLASVPRNGVDARSRHSNCGTTSKVRCSEWPPCGSLHTSRSWSRDSTNTFSTRHRNKARRAHDDTCASVQRHHEGDSTWLKQAHSTTRSSTNCVTPTTPNGN